jgi:hypothetical protein
MLFQVTLIAHIVTVDKRPYHTVYTLDDGTGVLRHAIGPKLFVLSPFPVTTKKKMLCIGPPRLKQ